MISTKNSISSTISEKYKENTLMLIKQNVDEICILGPNNKREIEVNLLSNSTIYFFQKEIGIDNLKTSVKCQLEEKSENIKNALITLENLGKKIIVTIEQK